MKIPVFVSRGSRLSPEQEEVYARVASLLEDHDLEPRTVGRSDYAVDTPLREVLVLGRHCGGGIILGFEELWIERAREGGRETGKVVTGRPQATMWAQLEAGLLYGLGIPLLVFREPGVEGGIFDIGSSDVFIQDLPTTGAEWDARERSLKGMFATWRGRVQAAYYQ